MGRATLTAIRENGATSGVGVLATYEYDQLGRRDRLVLGNGAVTDYQYDAASRLWKLTHDPAGTGHDNIVTLTYNPAGQIVGRVATNNAYAWTGHGSGTTDYATDGLNRLPSQTTGGATTSFSHDPRSNRTSDGTRTYVFDSENKSRGTATAPWHYDPLDRLSGVSTSPGTPPAIAYESHVDNLVAERTPGSSSVQRRHVFGPGVDEPLVWYEGSGTADRRFLQADERGSIAAVSNGSGAVQNVNAYDEYGRTQVSNNNWQSRFAYTGQRYFGGFGLYHYKSRMYDPKAGRFLQPDPIGYGGGMNMYAYVGGDPVNLTDPMGQGCLRFWLNHGILDLNTGQVEWTDSTWLGDACSSDREHAGPSGGGGGGGNPPSVVLPEPGDILVTGRRAKDNPWSSRDFILHYFRGRGETVDLGEVGLGELFKMHESVRAVVEPYKRKIMATRPNKKTTLRQIGHSKLTKTLFAMGKSAIYAESYCQHGACFFRFRVNDAFEAPLGPYMPEIPGGTTYRIIYEWGEIGRR